MTRWRIHLWQDHSPWSVLLTLLHLPPLPQQQQQLLGGLWLLLVNKTTKGSFSKPKNVAHVIKVPRVISFRILNTITNVSKLTNPTFFVRAHVRL